MSLPETPIRQFKMRRVLIGLILFAVILEGLRYVDIFVLISAMAALLAVVVCADLLLDSPSPR